jgi:hypothetical protein
VRVTDENVREWLVWARNYGEIESFEIAIASKSGRKWLIRLPPGITVTASNSEPGILERRIVPNELMMTNREALAFGMGLAIAGARRETRYSFAAREWGWGETDEASAAEQPANTRRLEE